MPLLNDELRQEISKILANLSGPVRLVVFTQDFECEYCTETRQLVEEIAELSERITAEIYDFQADRAKAEELGIDKIPACAIIGTQDYGVRFYGFPSGYEFGSLVQAILRVAAGTPELSDDTLRVVAGIQKPVHIQVFVTPTCPHCPQAVMLAHQLAIASPMVRADMVEVAEFPHLLIKYQVMRVPHTVINEMVHIEGAVPESYVVAKLQEALGA